MDDITELNGITEGFTHLQGAEVAHGAIGYLRDLVPMQEEEAEPRQPRQGGDRK